MWGGLSAARLKKRKFGLLSLSHIPTASAMLLVQIPSTIGENLHAVSDGINEIA
jgi:hypothetical protein